MQNRKAHIYCVLCTMYSVHAIVTYIPTTTVGYRNTTTTALTSLQVPLLLIHT